MHRGLFTWRTKFGEIVPGIENVSVEEEEGAVGKILPLEIGHFFSSHVIAFLLAGWRIRSHGLVSGTLLVGLGFRLDLTVMQTHFYLLRD